MTNRSVLRCHGGKNQQADWIISHFPHHRCYAEPFSGAASVLMNKHPSKVEIYNDLDGDVVNLFRVMRDQCAELQRLVELTPFARAEFDLAYEPTDEPVEKARRMLVRAAFGRASASASSPWKASFRNYSGAGPTTTAAGDWANYSAYMKLFSQRLQGVIIENIDALELMRQHDSRDTLFYLDPPYVTSTRDLAQDYRHEMSDDQHRELAKAVHSMEGMFVVSGYRSALYNELFGDWRCVTSDVFADGASSRQECLWLSPNIPHLGLFDERFSQGSLIS